MSRGLGLIGKYELQRSLGRGSSAEVWKAFDTQIKRSVALKLLHPDLQVAPDFSARFKREVPVISSLHHPNIVMILDYQLSRPRESDKLKAYIVMSYVKGRTLADYIRNTSRAGQFPSAADIVHLFTSVGGAIDYAHQHGVIHADIKPSNILLDKEYMLRNRMGEPKLTDFSIAKMLVADTGKFNSQLSTALYISPEQAMYYPAASELSDLYSLGVILYEFCTGKLPFEGESTSGILMQDISKRPPSPASINPNLSEAVSDVILRSLAKDPAERFSSASAMTGALAGALNVPAPENLGWFFPQSDNNGLSTLSHRSTESEPVELDESTPSLERMDEPVDQNISWSPTIKWWSPPAPPSPTTPTPPPVSTLPHQSTESEPVELDTSTPSLERMDEPVDQDTSRSPSTTWWSPPVSPSPMTPPSSTGLRQPTQSRRLGKPQKPAVEKPAPALKLLRALGTFRFGVRKQAAEKRVSVLQKHRPSSTRAMAGKVHNVPVVDELKGKDKQRIQGKRQKARRPYFVACALLLLLLSTTGSLFSLVEYQTYSAKYHADMSLAQEGIQHLQRGVALFETLQQNPLNAPTVQKAQHEFTASSKIFSQLDSELKSLPGLSLSLPTYGARLRAALHLLPIAIEVSQVGVIACNTLDLLISRFHSPMNTRAQGLMKADLSVINQNFQRIKTILNLVIGQVNRLQPEDLQLDPRLNKLVSTFHKDIPALQSQLDIAEKILPLAPTVIGIGTPTNYLIEVLDSTELRPGGGFIDGYGIITFSGGQLMTVRIKDVYSLDTPFEAAGGQIPFPASYSWFNLAPTWSFRDSNLDADFPTAARNAELTYGQEGGKVPVQGVIAVTPAFIERALAITGPIDVPEYHETITGQNLVARIHYYELGPGKQENYSQPKDFTEALADHFLVRLRLLSPSALLKLLQQMSSSLHSKDVQIYLNSSAAEHLLQSYHLDGAIQSPGSESLFVVNANIGANKANSLITNALNDQVTIDEKGNAVHRTTLRYAWALQGQSYGPSLYRDYLRVYVPPGSKLQMQDGWEPRGTSEAFAREVWAGFFTLSFGQTRTITLTWTVPRAASRDAKGWHYQYLIQHQAGAQQQMDVRVALPSCASIVNMSAGVVRASRQQAYLAQALTQDTEVSMDYTC